MCFAQVKLLDGRVRQCLVPLACLMNHSPWPHVIRYGQIDPGSRRLKFPVFRYTNQHTYDQLAFAASQDGCTFSALGSMRKQLAIRVSSTNAFYTCSPQHA